MTWGSTPLHLSPSTIPLPCRSNLGLLTPQELIHLTHPYHPHHNRRNHGLCTPTWNNFPSPQEITLPTLTTELPLPSTTRPHCHQRPELPHLPTSPPHLRVLLTHSKTSRMISSTLSQHSPIWISNTKQPLLQTVEQQGNADFQLTSHSSRIVGV
jgi:hypothetical protein